MPIDTPPLVGSCVELLLDIGREETAFQTVEDLRYRGIAGVVPAAKENSLRREPASVAVGKAKVTATHVAGESLPVGRVPAELPVSAEAEREWTAGGRDGGIAAT